MRMYAYGPMLCTVERAGLDAANDDRRERAERAESSRTAMRDERQQQNESPRANPRHDTTQLPEPGSKPPHRTR